MSNHDPSPKSTVAGGAAPADAQRRASQQSPTRPRSNSTSRRDAGPLGGVRVLEFASLAPAPFACTLLSDLGADVLRVTNPTDRGLTAAPHPGDPLDRGRTIVALDLKQPDALGAALDLAARADVLVEGMRPGVMERLGLGPDACLERNPRLIYAR
ncbi:CoA transferase, partial [Actinocrinis sp.]|uniref:CoA transferase n=1 Tax=Actinocrinis sp. TaxID=1920516 RepID=UPI002DDC97C0